LPLVAVLALALSACECDFLSSELGMRLRPLARRIAAATENICGTASAGFAREETAHAPGDVFAAVPSGRLAAGLDRDGYVVSIDSLGGFGDVPLLDGFNLSPTGAGRFASSPEAFLGLAVVKVFETTPGLAGRLSKVDLGDLEDPRVILKSGTVVRLGTGDYVLKLERLREVLRQTASLGMKPALVDLRFRDQVVVRPGTTRGANGREV